MLQIYRAMCPTYHQPLFPPIHLEIDVKGRTAVLRIPGVLDSAVEPIRSLVTGAAHRPTSIPSGREFRLAEVANGFAERAHTIVHWSGFERGGPFRRS